MGSSRKPTNTSPPPQPEIMTHKRGTSTFNADNWKDDIQKIWKRSLFELPVHTDVPRLAHKIIFKLPGSQDAQAPTTTTTTTTLSDALDSVASSSTVDMEPQSPVNLTITTPTGGCASPEGCSPTFSLGSISPTSQASNKPADGASPMSTTSDTSDTIRHLHSVLLQICDITADENSRDAISSSFSKFFPEDQRIGDVAQPLLAFMKDHIEPNSGCASVLKCCHQKMIFPPYYVLRQRLSQPYLRFCDVRGSWRIVIQQSANGNIDVIHSKRQLAQPSGMHAQDSCPNFEIHWEVTFTLQPAPDPPTTDTPASPTTESAGTPRTDTTPAEGHAQADTPNTSIVAQPMAAYILQDSNLHIISATFNEDNRAHLSASPSDLGTAPDLYAERKTQLLESIVDNFPNAEINRERSNPSSPNSKRLGGTWKSLNPSPAVSPAAGQEETPASVDDTL
eukprot:TRINITY_DN54222_c0_g1_i2.p1 TRINITY_DN54222_c0_g1~~TRINITY_DN54222_c0_g1_i2.p1  ORF type:complete len:451 (-),score=28.03 TRINITY_DN54222_c0_g1_i2:100-1452(-)